MNIKGLLQIWKAIHLRWNLCICNGVLSIKDGAVSVWVVYLVFSIVNLVKTKLFPSDDLPLCL